MTPTFEPATLSRSFARTGKSRTAGGVDRQFDGPVPPVSVDSETGTVRTTVAHHFKHRRQHGAELRFEFWIFDE